MALDHTRGYFHWNFFEPTDLEETNAALFATRWITHFCAPVFVFLSGTSAYLVSQKLNTKWALSRWLITRGLWLIFLEFTIVQMVWTFGIQFHDLAFMVIGAIGVSMIVLGSLSWLPSKLILILGIVIVAGHNLFDWYHPEHNFLWDLLHTKGVYDFENGYTLWIAYPVLPWIGVIFCGFGFGRLYTKNIKPALRKNWLLYLGIGLSLLFIGLRLSNIYGDNYEWGHEVHPILSFFNTTKYPPSFLYLCMTIGPSLLFLRFTERPMKWLGRNIVAIGRVPLFFYIIHIACINALSIMVGLLCGLPIGTFFGYAEWPEDYNFGLLATYGFWLLVVISLWPLCRWYNQVKSKSNSWVLKYL